MFPWGSGFVADGMHRIHALSKRRPNASQDYGKANQQHIAFGDYGRLELFIVSLTIRATMGVKNSAK